MSQYAHGLLDPQIFFIMAFVNILNAHIYIHRPFNNIIYSSSVEKPTANGAYIAKLKITLHPHPYELHNAHTSHAAKRLLHE
jgi:hypothetical protein